jgi:NAD(P)H-nitrite reductase large subunit
VCPWHAASFDCDTGDIEDGPPCMNKLATHAVHVINSEVWVARAPRESAVPSGATYGGRGRTVVVIGGGAAGVSVCEELRAKGFSGSIKLLSASKHVPYDPTILSKSFRLKSLRSRDYLSEVLRVDISLNTTVTAIDTKARAITIEGSDTIVSYDHLVVATGGKSRAFKRGEAFAIEGAELGNIYTVKTPDDTDAIQSTLESSSRVVIVGSSFIGMEVASCLKMTAGLAASVTVVGQEKVPFERVMGAEIGTLLLLLLLSTLNIRVFFICNLYSKLSLFV